MQPWKLYWTYSLMNEKTGSHSSFVEWKIWTNAIRGTFLSVTTDIRERRYFWDLTAQNRSSVHKNGRGTCSLNVSMTADTRCITLYHMVTSSMFLLQPATQARLVEAEEGAFNIKWSTVSPESRTEMRPVVDWTVGKSQTSQHCTNSFVGLSFTTLPFHDAWSFLTFLSDDVLSSRQLLSFYQTLGKKQCMVMKTADWFIFCTFSCVIFLLCAFFWTTWKNEVCCMWTANSLPIVSGLRFLTDFFAMF